MCRGIFTLLAALLAAISGCGYTVGTRVESANAARTVNLTPFKNMTDPHVAGAEIVLHSAVLDLVLPGPYRLASSTDADLIVTGEISRVQQSIVSLSNATTPLEVSLSIQVRVHVQQRWPVVASWSETISPPNQTFSQEIGETFEETSARAFRIVAREVINAFVRPQDRWGANKPSVAR